MFACGICIWRLNSIGHSWMQSLPYFFVVCYVWCNRFAMNSRSMPDGESLNKDTVLTSWMAKFDCILEGTEKDPKKPPRLQAPITSEVILSKEQLYDLFQQILGIKKFEHQILYNALMVSFWCFSCFVFLFVISQLFFFLWRLDDTIWQQICEFYFGFRVWNVIAGFGRWASGGHPTWARRSTCSCQRNGEKQKALSQVFAQRNGFNAHWRVKNANQSTHGELGIVAGCEKLAGLQVWHAKVEAIQSQYAVISVSHRNQYCTTCISLLNRDLAVVRCFVRKMFGFRTIATANFSF